MKESEVKFREWLVPVLKENQGSLDIEEVKNSGAFVCDCSQLTIERYLKKWAYAGEIAFVVVGKVYEWQVETPSCPETR